MSLNNKRTLNRLGILYRHPVTGKTRPLTGIKQANALLAKLEQKLNRIKVLSYPIYAVIEPTNACNLRCIFCPTGLGRPGRKKGMLKLEVLEKFLKQTGRYLLDTELCNWGESFLHPDIYGVIELIKRYNIHTAFSTNLSIKDNFDPEKVIRSGLDQLVVAVDSTNPETYARYRVGGDFHLVLDNVRSLVEAKRRLKSDSPYIQLKFVVFKHNEDEKDRFREMAGELGVNDVLFAAPFIPDQKRDEYQPEDPGFEIETFEPGQAGKNCHWLWTGVTMNWDGSISPCCHGISYFDDYDFGNIEQTPFREIWNNEIFQQARAVFTGVRPQAETADQCYQCRYRA